MTHKTWLAAGITLAVYTLLTLPFALWPGGNPILSLVSFILYSLLAAGLSIEFTELILALAWTPRHLPIGEGLPNRSETAILMTVCDDWEMGRIRRLTELTAIGYDVFILDDSCEPTQRFGELDASFVHLIRKNRKGAKAGNLNHWLRTYGSSYRYAILLDADSTLPIATADAMVATAQHPENDRVAVFQSKIFPDLVNSSLFARALSAGARPRMRVLERVHATLGLLLSFGHNQLLRVAAIREVGGFREELSAEDTALSLDLAIAGWKIGLVDAWSFDTDPSEVATYNRRTIRWAQQTIELFRHDWNQTPLALKMLLTRHLLSYLLPIAGVLLLGISLWTGPRSPNAVLSFLSSSLLFEAGYRRYGTAIAAAFGTYLVVMLLRIILARVESVSWSTLFLTILLGASHYMSLIVPLAAAMASAALGHRVPFVPTNSYRALRSDRSRHLRLGPTIASLLPAALLVAGACRHPGSLLVGFNLIWITSLVISPIALFLASLCCQHLRIYGESH